MSAVWVPFLGSSFLISFLRLVTDTFEKLNVEALYKSFIAIVLGWFAYLFAIGSENRIKVSSVKGTTPWKLGIYMSFTALEKNLLRICTIFTSSLTISLSMLPPVSRVFLCSIMLFFRTICSYLKVKVFRFAKIACYQ